MQPTTLKTVGWQGREAELPTLHGVSLSVSITENRRGLCPRAHTKSPGRTPVTGPAISGRSQVSIRNTRQDRRWFSGPSGLISRWAHVVLRCQTLGSVVARQALSCLFQNIWETPKSEARVFSATAQFSLHYRLQTAHPTSIELTRARTRGLRCTALLAKFFPVTQNSRAYTFKKWDSNVFRAKIEKWNICPKMHFNYMWHTWQLTYVWIMSIKTN